jgi:pimeloyl-ACP methyl ester carboxylesterase
MPFARCNRINLYYEVHGRGEPLLLIAGQGQDHHAWDGMRDELAAQNQVIVYDQRGTGWSEGAEWPEPETRELAGDAIDLLDYLGLIRAHCFGAGTGAVVCHALAMVYPERVGAVVLDCPPAEDWLKTGRAGLAGGGSRPARLAAGLSFAEVAPGAREGRLHSAVEEAHDTRDGLVEVAGPVLVIHGTEDPINPVAGRAPLAERLPGAEPNLAEVGRHGYSFEHREAVSRVVLDFLRRYRLG